MKPDAKPRYGKSKPAATGACVPVQRAVPRVLFVYAPNFTLFLP